MSYLSATIFISVWLMASFISATAESGFWDNDTNATDFNATDFNVSLHDCVAEQLSPPARSLSKFGNHS